MKATVENQFPGNYEGPTLPSSRRRRHSRSVISLFLIYLLALIIRFPLISNRPKKAALEDVRAKVRSSPIQSQP